MNVIDQEQANRLNESGMTDEYRAANWHLMRAPLLFPKDESGQERDYEVGDEIRYTSWNADCSENCRHDSPPEDW